MSVIARKTFGSHACDPKVSLHAHRLKFARSRPNERYAKSEESVKLSHRKRNLTIAAYLVKRFFALLRMYFKIAAIKAKENPNKRVALNGLCGVNTNSRKAVDVKLFSAANHCFLY